MPLRGIRSAVQIYLLHIYLWGYLAMQKTPTYLSINLNSELFKLSLTPQYTDRNSIHTWQSNSAVLPGKQISSAHTSNVSLWIKATVHKTPSRGFTQWGVWKTILAAVWHVHLLKKPQNHKTIRVTSWWIFKNTHIHIQSYIGLLLYLHYQISTSSIMCMAYSFYT